MRKAWHNFWADYHHAKWSKAMDRGNYKAANKHRIAGAGHIAALGGY